MEYTRESGQANFGEIVKGKIKPWFSADSLVLYKLKKIEEYKKVSGKKYLSCVLDTETTGLGKHDEITQISIVPFIFDGNMDICEVLHYKIYSSFNETKKDIPKDIQEMTRITPELTKGQSIDWEIVSKILSKMKAVIAHHSAFDKRMMKQYIDVEKFSWGCSSKNVNWKKQNFATTSLPTLSQQHGFWYDAHDSLEDSLAVIHILAHKNTKKGKSNLNELLSDIFSPTYRLLSENTPFNLKDKVKKQGFKWDPDMKCWWKGFKSKEEANSERRWLEENVSKECKYDKIVEE